MLSMILRKLPILGGVTGGIMDAIGTIKAKSFLNTPPGDYKIGGGNAPYVTDYGKLTQAGAASIREIEKEKADRIRQKLKISGR